jgi:hypothetical protein
VPSFRSCVKSLAFQLLSATLLWGAPLAARCQQGQLTGHVTTGDRAEGFAGVTLTLHQAGHLVTGTVTDTNGAFAFANLPLGTYEVVLEMTGYRRESHADIPVTAPPTSVTIPFPGPCRYRYSSQQLPACIGGHTDHFIPIVYGFPNQRTLHRAKQGKLYLGGCEVSGCDPQYYCPLHRKEL